MTSLVRRVTDAVRTAVRMPKRWSPRRAKVVVLHDLGLPLLEPLFGDEPYQVLRLDGELMYVDPRIAFSALCHFIRMRTLRPIYAMSAYALAVLERIKPAIAVTYVDNSAIFQLVGQRCPTVRFLAIQNGGRLPERDNPVGHSLPLAFREFACHGRFEVDQFVGHGARANTYYPIGSLKDAYYRAERRKDGPPAKEFDLCLPSQFKPSARFVFPERLEGFELLTQHVKRFCESHDVSLCVPLRKHPDRDPAGYEWERDFFETRLGSLAQVVPNVLSEYTTYEFVDRSRVSIGIHTTVLREGFGRGNRILSCNFTGNSVYTFSVPGPWALTDPRYDVFEERLLWLLHASEEEYAKVAGDVPAYLMSYDEKVPTHVFLQQLIADAVRGIPEPSSDRVV